ncbi:zinc finger protein 62 homolog [Anopheles darlingi]|uniref:zinc finger protein 62 homolog n=1 Tax=Anopheles darlingi TaxID=43151 RepID=UPI0021003E78|nr:zinc finger protein 62 homolog [Anopheles darlingi]
MVQLCCRICLEQRKHTELVSVFSMHDGFVIRDKLRELFDLEIGQTEMLTTICKSCLKKVCTARNIRDWFNKQNLKYQQLMCSGSDPQAGTNASNSPSMIVKEHSPLVKSTTHEEASVSGDTDAIEEGVQYFTVSTEDETIRCSEEALVDAQDDASVDPKLQQSAEFQVQLIGDISLNEQSSYKIVQLGEKPTIVTKDTKNNRCYISIDGNTFLGMDTDTESVNEEILSVQSEQELDEEESATSVQQNGCETAEVRDDLECSLCGMQFDLEAQLIDHGVETHGDRFELLQCKGCYIQFASKRSLRRHRCDAEGKFQCRYCEKVLKTRNAWKSHQNMHTGEKSFHCDLCDRKFSQYSSMRRHRLVHTDEKPYECEYCYKKFRQTCILQAHRRRHTGEKPYKCDVCGNSFRENSAFARHKTLHNRDHPGKGKV